MQTNGDYEDILLRLLAGEGDYLVLGSDYARSEIEEELRSPSPNINLYREYAAVDVRLNPLRRPRDSSDPTRSAMLAEEATPAPAPPSPSSGPPRTPGVSAPGPPSEAPPAEPPPEEGLAPASGPLVSRGHATSASSLAPRRPAAGRCSWCRQTLPRRDILNFCPFCGAALHKAPCPTCGEELEAIWRFCVTCGAAAGDPA